MLIEQVDQKDKATRLPDYEQERSKFPAPGWVKQNTAILVVHGIGHQQPVETLDQFSRGIIERYEILFPGAISFEHKLNTVAYAESPIFQNTIRINHKEHPKKSIDIYEYYWAYCTQDKAQMSDINVWLKGVANGAKKYYKKNEALGIKFEDESIFFKNGKFIAWKYDLFLNTVTKTYLFLNFLIKGLLTLFGFIPFIGDLAKSLLKSYLDSSVHKLSNLMGDIVIYNVTDEKSKFYPIRKQILEGATQVLQSLLEKTEGKELSYPAVFVAGHSLGSEIAYDAINRLNLLANTGNMKYYTEKGLFNEAAHDIGNAPRLLSGQLKGLITFGSPLDKIAFFLRQLVSDGNYIWQQVIDNYHCFKQGDWNLPFPKSKKMTGSSIHRILEDVKWVNYFDCDDIVSGRLDYFTGLTNVECKFNCSKQFATKKSKFTHSFYWACGDFYEDIIQNFLSAGDTKDDNKPKDMEPSVSILPINGLGVV